MKRFLVGLLLTVTVLGQSLGLYPMSSTATNWNWQSTAFDARVELGIPAWATNASAPAGIATPVAIADGGTDSTNAPAALLSLGAVQNLTSYASLATASPITGPDVSVVKFPLAPDLLYRYETADPGYGWPLVATNAVTNFWVARPGYVLADWCGAVGDGTTDDTDALAAAVACSYLSGYEVRLAGNKTYLVDNVNVVDPPVGWTFDGQGGTLKKSVTAEDVVFQVRAGTAHTDGVTIRNVTIDGNGQQQTTEKAGLAGFYYPVESILQTVAVVPAQGNVLVGVGIGFTEDTDFNHYFATIEDVNIENCGGSGVYVEPGAMGSLRVENLVLNRVVQHGVSFATGTDDICDIQIEGIRAEYCGTLFDIGGSGNPGKTTIQVRNGYAYKCWLDTKISAAANGVVSGLTFVDCGVNPRTEYDGVWASKYVAPFRVYPQTQNTLTISDIAVYKCYRGLELADVLADNITVDSSLGYAVTLTRCVANNVRVYNTDGVYGGAIEVNGGLLNGLDMKALKFDPVAITNQLAISTQPFTDALYVSGPARGVAAGSVRISNVLVEDQYCANGAFAQSWSTNVVVEGLRFVGTASGTSGNNIASTAQLCWTSNGDYSTNRNDSLLFRSCDFGNLTNSASVPFMVFNRRNSSGGVRNTAVRLQDCQGPVVVYDPSPNILLTPHTAGAGVTEYMSAVSGTAGLYAATDSDGVVRPFAVDSYFTNKIVNDYRTTVTIQRTSLDDSTDIMAQVGSAAPTIGTMDTEADWTETSGTAWAFNAGQWEIDNNPGTLQTYTNLTLLITGPRRYTLTVDTPVCTITGSASVSVFVGNTQIGVLTNGVTTTHTFTGVRSAGADQKVKFVAVSGTSMDVHIDNVTLKAWADGDLFHEHRYDLGRTVKPSTADGPSISIFASGTTASNGNSKTIQLAWAGDTGTPAVFEELTTTANDKPWTVTALVSALSNTKASWSGVFTVDGTPQAFSRYDFTTTNFNFTAAGYIYIGGNADTADSDLLLNQSRIVREH